MTDSSAQNRIFESLGGAIDVALAVPIMLCPLLSLGCQRVNMSNSLVARWRRNHDRSRPSGPTRKAAPKSLGIRPVEERVFATSPAR